MSTLELATLQWVKNNYQKSLNKLRLILFSTGTLQLNFSTKYQMVRFSSRSPVKCTKSHTHSLILTISDPKWFKLVKPVDSEESWVLKFNQLKKFNKLMTSYYEQILQQSTSNMAPINVTAIARDKDIGELMKLVQWVIVMCVSSDKNSKYIHIIQSMMEDYQHSLMVMIEQVIKSILQFLIDN